MSGPFTLADVRPGPCHGSVHTIPVPRWMSPEEAWAAICAEGRLPEEDPDCTWAVITCPGGTDCMCGTGHLADDFRSYDADVLVYDHASTLAVGPP